MPTRDEVLGRLARELEGVSERLASARSQLGEISREGGRRLREARWRRVRLGWILLALLGAYAVVSTVQLGAARRETAEARAKVGRLETRLAETARALTWPVVGAGLPESAENLPGAPRVYRRGVSQGFVFEESDAGVPVSYGTPVVAAGDGEVSRADLEHRELSPAAFGAMLARVRGGAGEGDLDRLRGRQIWLRHADGTVTRYGHLSRIHPSVHAGARVRRGQIIGAVGNSGTLEGARGTRGNARLQFEVWTDGRFLGQGLGADEARGAAAARIKPWS